MLKSIACSLIAVSVLAAPAAAANTKPDKRERRICKRDIKTDSLVAPRRLCLTATEWKEAHRGNRRIVDDWQKAIDGAQRAN
jgi:hypothetical protein